jgi:hypothetical protein
MSCLTVAIGVDTREPVSFAVLVHSLITHATCPLRIIPIALSGLHHVWQPPDVGATQFSLSRWLTPWLVQYDGLVLYLDSDMLALADPVELLFHTISQPNKAVWVVQHDYTPSQDTKMWGVENKPYRRKNWSSLVLFDANRCQQLSRAYLKEASPADLHQFNWLSDDDIGSLPKEWNVLAGEPNQTTEPPKLIHYTLGVPALKGYEDCEYSDLWWKAYREMLTPCQG